MTDVRFVINGRGQGEVNGALAGVEGPTVRLACGDRQAERDSLGPPAHPGCETGLNNLANRPALLVSYVYLAPFLAKRDRYHFRDWAMDSGAFSAHNSGTEIDLQAYIDTCKNLRATDPQLSDIFSLDVIGDWRAGLKNCEEMWRQGIEAIPTYHVGEPAEVLVTMARDYPKIALGGAVGYRGKDAWAAQCFARVWPKKIHGLGFGGEKSIMALPWHSVDASNWELGPCKFGRWQVYGQLPVRGSSHNLKTEVEWYLQLEQRARHRWRKAMAQLNQPASQPAIRLAYGTLNQKRNLGFEMQPSVRLAFSGPSNSRCRGIPREDVLGESSRGLQRRSRFHRIALQIGGRRPCGPCPELQLRTKTCA